MGDLQDPIDGATLVPYFWPYFAGDIPSSLGSWTGRWYWKMRISLWKTWEIPVIYRDLGSKIKMSDMIQPANMVI
jgi:hypothetical protein